MTYGLPYRKWSNTYDQFKEKRSANYCLNLRKSKVNNLKFFQNCKTRLTRALNTITVGRARAMEEEEMYLL